MKTGAWIEAGIGRWHWVDDHADWIRRPECARRAGLPEDVVLRIAAMPRQQRSGSERTAILLEAMKFGLIRFRGHGAEVTFETTMPLGTAIQAVAPFMAEQFGPRTMVRFNQLPDGPFIAVTYQDLVHALEAGDLASLLTPGNQPRWLNPSPVEPIPSGTGNTRPSLSPIWERYLCDLQNLRLSSGDQVRRLENAKAPAEVLKEVIIRLYRPEFSWLCCRGLSFTEGRTTPMERLELCSWAVTVLHDPEPVVACFGHTLLDVFAFRVESLPPERWLQGTSLEVVDPMAMAAITNEGFRFESLGGPADLTWIRKGVHGCLEIIDPLGPLRLPPHLCCRGRFQVRGAWGFTRLHGLRVLGDHGTALIENCPDLEDLVLPRANHVEVRGCASLRRIRVVRRRVPHSRGLRS